MRIWPESGRRGRGPLAAAPRRFPLAICRWTAAARLVEQTTLVSNYRAYCLVHAGVYDPPNRVFGARALIETLAQRDPASQKLRCATLELGRST